MPVPNARADLILRLFDDYYDRVYAFLRKSATPDLADDLAQEVFVRLLQHPQLEDLTISASYLIKIAHNLLRRRHARATRLRELLAERSAGECFESEDGSPRPRVVDSTVLEAALGLLSNDEQNAVRLIVCEGKSYQHAAESLGVTVTTVNNWKHRGLTKMRRMLDEADAAHEQSRRSVPGRQEREARASHFLHGRDEARMTPRPTVQVHGQRWSRGPEWATASDDVA